MDVMRSSFSGLTKGLETFQKQMDDELKKAVKSDAEKEAEWRAAEEAKVAISSHSALINVLNFEFLCRLQLGARMKRGETLQLLLAFFLQSTEHDQQGTLSSLSRWLNSGQMMVFL
jgi:hypothetical protein